MSNESFGDIAKKLSGKTSKDTQKSEPTFKSKPLNEDNESPKFKSITEVFERRDS